MHTDFYGLTENAGLDIDQQIRKDEDWRTRKWRTNFVNFWHVSSVGTKALSHFFYIAC